MQLNPPGRSLGYSQLTFAAAGALTIPAGCQYAIVIATTQAFRWRDDGTAPTAAIGMPLAVNVERRFEASDLVRLQFIEQAPTGSLNVTFYGS